MIGSDRTRLYFIDSNGSTIGHAGYYRFTIKSLEICLVSLLMARRYSGSQVASGTSIKRPCLMGNPQVLRGNYPAVVQSTSSHLPGYAAARLSSHSDGQIFILRQWCNHPDATAACDKKRSGIAVALILFLGLQPWTIACLDRPSCAVHPLEAVLQRDRNCERNR